MKKTKICFHSLDRKRVHLLCSRVENGEQVAQGLSERGYVVELSTSPQEFYQRVSVGKPGFAMVSTAMEGEMAKLLPDFLTKRFQVPVILFKEHESSPEPKDFMPGPLVPEIQLSEGSGVGDLNKMLEGFEERYALEVEGLGKKPVADAPKAVSKVFKTADAIFALLEQRVTKRPVALNPDETLQVHSYSVPDPEGKGAFVFAFPCPDVIGFEDTLLALENMIREQLGEGTTIENMVESVHKDFYQSLSSNADRVIQGTMDGCELLVAFFGHPTEAPAASDTKLGNGAWLVPVEEWWTQLPLPCQAFVWMEKNQRHVLYIKTGARLRGESLTRFRAKGFMFLSVSQNDYENFKKIRELARLVPGTQQSAPKLVGSSAA